MTKTIALVTGANKGVGREVTAQLAARGITVYLGARNHALGEQAARELIGDIRPVHLDVTDPAGIAAAAALIDRAHGHLDILVNNAGISGHANGQTPSITPAETVRAVFDTNVIGVVAVTNAMLPLLRRSPAARVVNVSSAVGSLTYQTSPAHYLSTLAPAAAYPASKAALNMLTIQYARELAGDGILVNAVTPGPCATDFTRHLAMDITRTAADGAAAIVALATLGPDGASGGFYDEDGTVPW